MKRTLEEPWGGKVQFCAAYAFLKRLEDSIRTVVSSSLLFCSNWKHSVGRLGDCNKSSFLWVLLQQYTLLTEVAKWPDVKMFLGLFLKLEFGP